MLNLPMFLLEKYAVAVDKKPIITNGILGMLVAALGDFLCQIIENKRNISSSSNISLSWDKKRSFNLALIRGFLVIPFVVRWYAKLAELYPETTTISLLKRCLTNEVLGSPLMIALVFLGNAILTTSTPKIAWNAFIDRYKKQGISTWISSFSFWPLCHVLVTFRLPLHYQPLWASFAAVYWNAILSYHTNVEL